MPVEYFKLVFLPLLKQYADIDFNVKKRGYYPQGGGVLELMITPKSMKNTKAIDMIEKGKLSKIVGISHSSSSLKKASVAERQAKAAESILKNLKVPVNIITEYSETSCPGSGITLAAEYEKSIIGSDTIGERGKPAEKVGEEAARQLLKEIEADAAVDSHLADNLIPFLGLFGGRIKVTDITYHTRTNIYVVEQFLDVKFSIEEEKRIISVISAKRD
jgi:RNA 3'-phosphate cyclase